MADRKRRSRPPAGRPVAGEGPAERLLRWGILAGAALLLATPLVVTPDTVQPFVVGKALYARSLIGIVFALWVALALMRPECRPPRSSLLVLLGAGLVVAALSAVFGASPVRSFWSDYPRMQGVIDRAHWFALALVLVSTLRTVAAWRTLLRLHLGVGVAVAALAVAAWLRWDVPFYGALPEPTLPRIGGPLGNAGFLAACMLANALLAGGFAASAAVRPASAGVAPAPRGLRRLAASRWTGGVGWSAVAVVHLCGLVLAGSVAGYLGLAGALGVLALVAVWRARGRRRLFAAAAVMLLAAALAVVGARALDSGRAAMIEVDAPLFRYAGKVHVDRPSTQARLGAWEAGLSGFAERPLLGWGPENFDAAYGRHASGFAAAWLAHDRAHNAIVETAVTTGVPGLAAWLALWAATFLALARALPRLGPEDRALALFAGAALAGRLVQNQFTFDGHASALQHVLLLGFAASLEAGGARPARRPRLPARVSAIVRAAAQRRRAARTAAVLAAIALAAAGLFVNRTIHAAANAEHLAARPVGSTGIEEAIDGFGPLANHPRELLFEDFTKRWPRLRAERGTGARRVLAWVDGEAAAAVRAEPENWVIAHGLARMYRAVAATEPDYRGRARRELARARKLAPNRAVFPAALTDPEPLSIGAAGGGRLELRWRPAEGAAWHQVGVRRGEGRWRVLAWLYEPDAAVLSVPGPHAPASEADAVFGIKACSAERCGAWIPWPAAARNR